MPRTSVIIGITQISNQYPTYGVLQQWHRIYSRDLAMLNLNATGNYPFRLMLLGDETSAVLEKQG